MTFTLIEGLFGDADRLLLHFLGHADISFDDCFTLSSSLPVFARVNSQFKCFDLVYQFLILLVFLLNSVVVGCGLFSRLNLSRFDLPSQVLDLIVLSGDFLSGSDQI